MSDPPTPPEHPPHALVCVAPDDISWWDAFRQKTWYKKWLSDGIAWGDRGPYSHNALRIHDCVYDARLSDGVSAWPHEQLFGLDRQLGYYRHAASECDGHDPSLLKVWTTIAELVDVDRGIDASADLPPDEEIDRFSTIGLFNLALILLISDDGIVGWLGRRLIDSRVDFRGYFCSELIAKGFVAAGVELEVRVEATRIPLTTEKQRRIARYLADREAAFGGVGSADLATADAFEHQLRSLASAIESNDVTTVPVGYHDPERLTYPPAYVTPNDLARSPTFVFCHDRLGSEVEPELTDEQRRASRRTWVRWTFALLPLLIVRHLLQRFRADPWEPIPVPEPSPQTSAAPVVDVGPCPPGSEAIEAGEGAAPPLP